MKKGRFLTTLAAVALTVVTMSISAFAADSVPCAEADCDGVYENGFCTADATHYQAASKVSADHHAELKATHNGYYAIENAGQLYWFAKNVNAQTIGTSSSNWNNTSIYVVVNAVLTDNITDNVGVLDENGALKTGVFRAWTPIGIGSYSTSVYFSGVFDGNGKTVSGLYRADSSTRNIALIAATIESKAVIKNVTVKDSYFFADCFVAGIVGSLGNGKMENCHSYATVKGETSIGGVVGYINNQASAEGCTNHGLVFGSNMTGGFVGELSGNAKVKNCANYGDVCWVRGSEGYMGGFVGSTSSGNTMENCFNCGDVTYSASNAYDNYIGGFVGDAYRSTFTNCYTTGAVTTATYKDSDRYRTGGFAGSDYNSALTNCYYNKDNVTKSGETVTTGDGNGTEYTDEKLLGVTTAEIESGKVAYLLNGDQRDIVFYQTLASDKYPTFSGKQVYHNEAFDKYYNLDGTIFGVKEEKVYVSVPSAGDYVLVVARYNGKALQDVKLVPFTAQAAGEASADLPDGLTLGTNDKLMLLKSLATVSPLCEAYEVK